MAAATAAIGAAALGLGAPPALAAETPCPNAQFRVGASLDLPDCRAYEQVTSVNKRANGLKQLRGTTLNPGLASPDGDTLMYTPVQGPTTDNAARGYSFPEVATRTADGWVRRAAANGPAPQAVLNTTSASFGYQVPDVSRTKLLFLSALPFEPDQPFVRTSSNGGVYLARGERVDWLSRPTWAGALPAQGTTDAVSGRFMPVGGSEDLSTSYFQTLGTLTPEDDASGRMPLSSWALYRWQNGQLSNAAVLPPGSGFPGGVDPAGSVAAGLAPGTGNSGSVRNNKLVAQWAYTHSVSTDGSGLLFVSPAPGGTSGRPPQLYLARTGQATVELSKRPDAATAVAGTTGVRSTGGIVGTPTVDTGVFAVATPDQRVVIFSTQDALTDAAEAVDPAVVKTYRYDATDGSLTYLPDLDQPVSNTGMVFNLSPDGTRMLYRNASDELRLWRKGQPTITLSTGVGPTTRDRDGISESRFSSDGHTLVLMSRVPLRGEASHPAGGQGAQSQVYRYTEDDDRLECLSCAPRITLGPASFLMQGIDNGFGFTNKIAPLASTRGMSDDGRVVFFTTTSPLSPNDNNTAADVYEWRDGATHLLSSGATGSLGDFLLDSSASGNDVFILSRSVLTASDTDDVYDVYNARVNGGFAPPVKAVVPCEGDACQGAIVDTPGPLAAAGSVSFAGGGNLLPKDAGSDAKVRVSKVKTVRGTSTRLKVKAPGKGKIRVSGSGVSRASKTAKQAKTYRVTLKLSKHSRSTLRRKHRVKVRATVRFTPAKGKTQRVRVSVTFKPKASKRKRSSSRSVRRVSDLSSDARKGR